MAIKYAAPGSISHGTLRCEDLINTFYAELCSLLRKCERESAECEVMRAIARVGDTACDAIEAYTNQRADTLVAGADFNEESDDAHELVLQLSEALELFAPPGHYFGAHWGDGADFGFWPSEDEPVE